MRELPGQARKIWEGLTTYRRPYSISLQTPLPYKISISAPAKGKVASPRCVRPFDSRMDAG